MHQQTFAEVTFEQYRKPTRREQFLNEMHRVVPWAELVSVIASRKTRHSMPADWKASPSCASGGTASWCDSPSS